MEASTPPGAELGSEPQLSLGALAAAVGSEPIEEYLAGDDAQLEEPVEEVRPSNALSDAEAEAMDTTAPESGPVSRYRGACQERGVQPHPQHVSLLEGVPASLWAQPPPRAMPRSAAGGAALALGAARPGDRASPGQLGAILETACARTEEGGDYLLLHHLDLSGQEVRASKRPRSHSGYKPRLLACCAAGQVTLPPPRAQMGEAELGLLLGGAVSRPGWWALRSLGLRGCGLPPAALWRLAGQENLRFYSQLQHLDLSANPDLGSAFDLEPAPGQQAQWQPGRPAAAAAPLLAGSALDVMSLWRLAPLQYLNLSGTGTAAGEGVSFYFASNR